MASRVFWLSSVQFSPFQQCNLLLKQTTSSLPNLSICKSALQNSRVMTPQYDGKYVLFFHFKNKNIILGNKYTPLSIKLGTTLTLPVYNSGFGNFKNNAISFGIDAILLRPMGPIGWIVHLLFLQFVKNRSVFVFGDLAAQYWLMMSTFRLPTMKDLSSLFFEYSDWFLIWIRETMFLSLIHISEPTRPY